MNGQNSHEIDIVTEDSEDVQNTVSASCTAPVSLSADFNPNQVQWATLGPQNTYITFHTLPFNLDQLRDASDLTAGAGGELSIIAGERPGGGQDQFVLTDQPNSKHDVAISRPSQFIVQPAANKQFSSQTRFILQSGAGNKETVYSDPAPGPGQSQIILQSSGQTGHSTSYRARDQTEFIMSNETQDEGDSTYTETDLSQFIMPNTAQSGDASYQSQFMIQSSTQSDHDTYTDNTDFIIPNTAEDKSEAPYAETLHSDLTSQFDVERSAVNKTDNVLSGGSEAQISSGNKSETVNLSQDATADLNKLSIFSNITVTLSSTLLDVIPDSHSLLMEEINSESDSQLQETEHGYTVTGSLELIVHLYNRLQETLNIPGSSRLKFVGDEKTKTEAHHKGTNCNILVPFVSSRGREIHQPARYSGCLQLQELDNDVDEDDRDAKSVLSKRGRKSHPKKLRGYVVSMKQEKAAMKNEVSKPIDALIHAATGEVNTQENQNQYVYDSSLEYTPKYIGSKRSEKSGKNYEAMSPFKFFCQFCSFRTKRESHFIKHRKLHENNSTKLHHCSKCNFVSVRLSVLRRHEIIHSTHIFQCNVCPYKADNLKLLRRHKLLRHESNHEKRNRLKFCPDCDFKTVHDTLYHRHLQTHTSSRVLPSNGTVSEYVCSECSYTTLRKEHYLRHRKNVHGNIRPFLCDTCGMAFKRPDTLAQHKIVHIDRKDRMFAFTCSQCNKGFRSQAHLKEHETMHSKDRPFLCDHCGASFKTPQVQKKHIQTIHLNPRSFSCDQCNKRFNTKYALFRHKRTHEMQQNNMHTTTEIPTMDIGQTDIAGLSSDQLSEIDPDTLQTIQTQQALDVVGAAMEETFDQSDETLQQAYIQPNETTTALLYLTGNLQNIEYNPS